jgi:hypothetical protein
MKRVAVLALAGLTAAALAAGCASAPSGESPPGRGSAVTTTSGSGAGVTRGYGQPGSNPGVAERELAGLTSGWIDAYAKSDADGGKAVTAYTKEHASDRFQDEWVSGDMTYVMRSYAVTGVTDDARSVQVTIRYDIVSVREPATTPGGKPTYRPAPPFDVTYTWIKTPGGWQLDKITKKSDGSDFGAPVVYGR